MCLNWMGSLGLPWTIDRSSHHLSLFLILQLIFSPCLTEWINCCSWGKNIVLGARNMPSRTSVPDLHNLSICRARNDEIQWFRWLPISFHIWYWCNTLQWQTNIFVTWRQNKAVLRVAHLMCVFVRILKNHIFGSFWRHKWMKHIYHPCSSLGQPCERDWFILRHCSASLQLSWCSPLESDL